MLPGLQSNQLLLQPRSCCSRVVYPETDCIEHQTHFNMTLIANNLFWADTAVSRAVWLPLCGTVKLGPVSSTVPLHPPRRDHCIPLGGRCIVVRLQRLKLPCLSTK